GRPVTFAYTVRNRSNTDAKGEFTDSIYVSPTRTLTEQSRLVARRTHNGLRADETYTEQFTAPLPGIADGTGYVIVVTDSRGNVPDADRQNNTRVSAGSTVINDVLQQGGSVGGTIADGQEVYYKIDVRSQNVRLNADFRN